jgi:CheY-like chemotaxis protein
MGYSADVAGNGLEAIDAVERKSYDVVLMDVQMPEMDGLEATRHIVEHVDVARRPWTVAMTANAMDGDRETVHCCRHAELHLQADPGRRAGERTARSATATG